MFLHIETFRYISFGKFSLNDSINLSFISKEEIYNFLRFFILSNKLTKLFG